MPLKSVVLRLYLKFLLITILGLIATALVALPIIFGLMFNPYFFLLFGVSILVLPLIFSLFTLILSN